MKSFNDNFIITVAISVMTILAISLVFMKEVDANCHRCIEVNHKSFQTHMETNSVFLAR